MTRTTRRALAAALLFAPAVGCAEVTHVPETPSGQSVRVAVETTEPGPVLYQQDGQFEVRTIPAGPRGVKTYPSYVPLCQAPCEIDLDPARPVYVAGPGVTRTEMMKLPPEGPMTMTVRPGSSAKRVAGAIGILGGFAAAGTGTFFAVGGEAVDRPRWVAPGATAIGVGVSAMVLGAVLIATSNSHVDLNVAR